MATTLKDLRRLLGGPGYVSDYKLGTASSNTNSATLADNTLVAQDDTFNWAHLYVATGSASTNKRVISDYASTGVLTPDRAFSAGITAGDEYEIHRLFSQEEKDAAINRAIVLGGEFWWRRTEDESLTQIADTYAYSLASLSPAVDRLWGVDQVEIEVTTGAYGIVDKDSWWLRDDNGVLYLQFDVLPGATDDKFRIIYRVRPSTLTTDASTLDPDIPSFINYILEKAKALLYQGKADDREESQRDHWQMRADVSNQQAEMYLTRARQGIPNARPLASTW